MNSEEFKERYFPFNRKLFRVALRILGNTADAEDAIQEVYLKLWNIREKLADTLNPEAFAITVTKNYCIDRLKLKHTVNFQESHNLVVSHEYNPYERVEQKDNNNKLLQLIELLPEPQKSILIFRDVENFSFEEIQDITGLTVNNIRVNLSRARKQIRDEFLKFHQYGTERNKETSGQIL
jgi:RNA polymerase sigma-70 factor, ECF subfamily